MMIINHSLDLGGIGEDITYPQALIECLLRSPSLLDVRTGGSLFGFSIGGPTDELYPFTKSCETGLG